MSREIANNKQDDLRLEESFEYYSQCKLLILIWKQCVYKVVLIQRETNKTKKQNRLPFNLFSYNFLNCFGPFILDNQSLRISQNMIKTKHSDLMICKNECRIHMKSVCVFSVHKWEGFSVLVKDLKSVFQSGGVKRRKY